MGGGKIRESDKDLLIHDKRKLMKVTQQLHSQFTLENSQGPDSRPG